MVPTVMDTEKSNVEFGTITDADLPSKTYKMQLGSDRVVNYTDGKDAIKQAIFKIVNTERYTHNAIYSNNYGIELKELYGMPMAYCLPEVERRIREALTWDERITDIQNYTTEIKGRTMSVSFTAVTIFGEVSVDGLEVILQ